MLQPHDVGVATVCLVQPEHRLGPEVVLHTLMNNRQVEMAIDHEGGFDPTEADEAPTVDQTVCMAVLSIDGGQLNVDLSGWEKVGSLRRSDVSVPLSVGSR